MIKNQDEIRGDLQSIKVDGQRLLSSFNRIQVIVVSLTVALGIAASLFSNLTGNDKVFGLIPFLDVGRESNLPTYVSTINLLVAAIICFALNRIALTRVPGNARYWLILAIVFIYLSVDEAAMVHEKFGNLRAFIPDFSVINERHTWLILGGVLAGFFALLVLPFLSRLPRRTALWFAVAGSVFAGGVLGMEFVGSLMLNRGIQPDDAIYQARRLLEEALEMYGIVIFNCVAFRELAQQSAGLELKVNAAR